MTDAWAELLLACDSAIEPLRRVRCIAVHADEAQAEALLSECLDYCITCSRHLTGALLNPTTHQAATEAIDAERDAFSARHPINNDIIVTYKAGVSVSSRIVDIAKHVSPDLHKSIRRCLSRVFRSPTIAQMEDRRTITVAPLSSDAFFLAVLKEFHDRCTPPSDHWRMGIAATVPWPELMPEDQSRCYLPNAPDTDFPFEVFIDTYSSGQTFSQTANAMYSRYPQSTLIQKF
ncbi:MAG: hypothetical protein Q7R81_03495 [Candidatus Peregrinibacteria bacterium]|nr:hypothetical protein [Candidatus Peregrinibacteria bacterium]